MLLAAMLLCIPTSAQTNAFELSFDRNSPFNAFRSSILFPEVTPGNGLLTLWFTTGPEVSPATFTLTASELTPSKGPDYEFTFSGGGYHAATFETSSEYVSGARYLLGITAGGGVTSHSQTLLGFGASYGPATVPEPSTLSLVFAGGGLAFMYGLTRQRKTNHELANAVSQTD